MTSNNVWRTIEDRIGRVWIATDVGLDRFDQLEAGGIEVEVQPLSGTVQDNARLLGLIALPQMLRLGYNQNLAIGTICASGSLGTMIPPSIVLIFYGLITETSIKALFTAAFVPGFMLAITSASIRERWGRIPDST